MKKALDKFDLEVGPWAPFRDSTAYILRNKMPCDSVAGTTMVSKEYMIKIYRLEDKVNARYFRTYK